ncbi:7430_t:CDS:2 [Acaulospora morrowiae]|uniref:7430_t:CDS:1 n=1 Tax=Acaulospora morrowiae TaxID=94023 RepID=A0A9N9AEA6_9GLOM|nr:7430_t:CDS:2 [Acaulospora morrowiae]
MTKKRKNNSASVWEATAILKERYDKEKERLCYLVQWAGEDEHGNKWNPTWEPDVNCGSALIDEWNERKKRNAIGSGNSQEESTMDLGYRKNESTPMLPTSTKARSAILYSSPVEPTNKKSLINGSPTENLRNVNEKKKTLDEPLLVDATCINTDSKFQDSDVKSGSCSISDALLENGQSQKNITNSKGIQRRKSDQSTKSITRTNSSSSSKSYVRNNSSPKSLGKRPALSTGRAVTIFKGAPHKEKYSVRNLDRKLGNRSDTATDSSERNVTKSPMLGVEYSDKSNLNGNGSQQFFKLTLPSRSGRLFIAKQISPQINRTIPNKRSKSAHTPTNTDVDEKLASHKKPRYEESLFSEEEETIISGQVLTVNQVRLPIEGDNVIVTRTLHNPSPNSTPSPINVINDPKVSIQKSPDASTMIPLVRETSDSQSPKLPSNSSSQHRASIMEIVTRNVKASSSSSLKQIQSPVTPKSSVDESEFYLSNRPLNKLDGKFKNDSSNLLKKSKFDGSNSTQLYAGKKLPPLSSGRDGMSTSDSRTSQKKSANTNNADSDDNEEEGYIISSRLVPSNSIEPAVHNLSHTSKISNGQNEVTPIRKPVSNGQNEVTPIRKQVSNGPGEMTPMRKPVNNGQNEVTPIRKPVGNGQNEVTPTRKPVTPDDQGMTEEIEKLRKEISKNKEELKTTKKNLIKVQEELEKYKRQDKKQQNDQKNASKKVDVLNRSPNSRDCAQNVDIACHGFTDFSALREYIIRAFVRIEEISSKFDALRNESDNEMRVSSRETSSSIKRERLRRIILEKELELVKETSMISKDTIKFLSELSFSMGLSLGNSNNSINGIRANSEDRVNTGTSNNQRRRENNGRNSISLDNASVNGHNSQNVNNIPAADNVVRSKTTGTRKHKDVHGSNFVTVSDDDYIILPKHPVSDTSPSSSSASSNTSPNNSMSKSPSNSGARRKFTAISGFPSTTSISDSNPNGNKHTTTKITSISPITDPSSSKTLSLIGQADRSLQNNATTSSNLGMEHIGAEGWIAIFELKGPPSYGNNPPSFEFSGFIIATIISILNLHKKNWLNFNIVAFGDSLTDNGNLWKMSNGTIPSEKIYFQGRWTNGFVWVELVESRLGAKLTDCAFGGALTDKSLNGSKSEKLLSIYSVPSVKEQVEGILPNITKFPPQTTFTFWSGSNDYMKIFENNLTITPTDIIASIQNSVSLLSSSGARRFLFLNLPPIHRIPHYKSYNNLTRLQDLVENHNILLNNTISSITKSKRIQAEVFDVWGFAERVLSDPQKFGFKNTVDSCLNLNKQESVGGTGLNKVTGTNVVSSIKTCENPDEYLWWDDVHPTTKAHELLAKEIVMFLKSLAGSCLYLASCG